MRYLLTHPMSFNNTIIRRSFWESIGGCDESLEMWEDADAHLRLARAGARFFHVPEVLTHALRHGDSFSHDYRKSWTCRVAALERYATAPGSDDITLELAREAERAASELAFLGARPAAERALALCRQLGSFPPNTGSMALRFLKIFFPAYPLLRWQARHRQRPHAPKP